MRWLATGMYLLATSLQAASPAGPPLLDLGYRQMYNLDFDQAHRTFEDFERQRPADALGPVSNAAAYLFAEFDRLNILQAEFFVDDNTFTHPRKLTPDPAVRDAFQREISKASQLATAILARTPEDRDALFATILTIGLKADYEGLIDKHYLASVRGLKEGRLLAHRLLALDPNYYDAYLAIGVENYLLSQKPAPVRWILQWNGAETDKQTGIDNTRLTAEKGHYLRPYGKLLIAVAALRDKDRKTAIQILEDLSRQFPRNRLYTQQLARLKAP